MTGKNREYKKDRDERLKEQRNEDPLSGAAGAHPAGAGIGAALGGAAMGAGIGGVAGPVGTVLGTVVGGIAGGLAGKAIAETIDPTVETAYWRSEFHNRPYYNSKYSYDEYEPAFRVGWESFDPQYPSPWTEREQIARER